MQRNNDSHRNVIEMTRFLGDTRFPGIAELEAYWEGLRSGGGVPMRSDIDPRGIENALEYAFILERIAPGMARLRIAGMHLNELMGMETRGMPITSFFPPAERQGFADTLEAVMAKPATAKLTLKAEQGIGKPALEGKMILLPLQSDLGEVTRIIGCMSTIGAIGRSPRRFEVVETQMRDIQMTAATSNTPREKAFAEAPTKFETRPTDTNANTQTDRHTGRPEYLRLIKTDT